jgi:hypothetical protein
MAGKPWAIILCNASDVPPGANSSQRWEGFFTATNTDPGGAFAYWHDILYGISDLTGSQVFGWYDLGQTKSEVQSNSRSQNFDLGLNLPEVTSLDLTGFAHKIVVVNVSTDHGSLGIGSGTLFGYEDSRALEPTFMFHEMGHGIGLDHSFGEQSVSCGPGGDSRPGAYCDSWDVMSAMLVFSYQDAQNRRSGPGLNAPNLQHLGVVDPTRIWSLPSAPVVYDVPLAAINRPDVNGYLMVTFPGQCQDLTQEDLSTYYLEFRQTTQWDQGVPGNSVLIHEVRASDGYSRLLTNWNGGQLLVGQQFVTPDLMAFAQVTSIDPVSATATVRLFSNVPGPVSVTVNPNSLCVSNPTTGTVTLSRPAPADMQVELITVASSGDSPAPGILVPPNVTVLAGHTSATFSITATTAALGSVTINASVNGSLDYPSSVNVVVPIFDGPVHMSFEYPGGDPPLFHGATGVFTIWVCPPAPAGGGVVSIANNKPGALQVPASVAIPEGATSVSFNAVDSYPTFAEVIVTATYEGISESVNVFLGKPIPPPPPPHGGGNIK